MAVRYRSSVTGRWVTKRFARRHPRTTEAERVNAVKAVLISVVVASKPDPKV